MPLTPLFNNIISLTTQVEELILAENEEGCAKLLAERQLLLVQLEKTLTTNLSGTQASDNKLKEEYRLFLTSIQCRDVQFLAQLITLKNTLATTLKLQVKGMKAMSAYKKILIDQL